MRDGESHRKRVRNRECSRKKEKERERPRKKKREGEEKREKVKDKGRGIKKVKQRKREKKNIKNQILFYQHSYLLWLILTALGDRYWLLAALGSFSCQNNQLYSQKGSMRASVPRLDISEK